MRVSDTQNPDRQAICNMLPHGEGMCLIDQVHSWDRQAILCFSDSHRRPDHPLRNQQGLPLIVLLEYGAQVMAIHGCLLAATSGMKMQEGYLAALREVVLGDGWLSDVDAMLEIHAQQIFADAGNMIYAVTIKANQQLLASARVTAVGKMIQETQ